MNALQAENKWGLGATPIVLPRYVPDYTPPSFPGATLIIAREYTGEDKSRVNPLPTIGRSRKACTKY